MKFATILKLLVALSVTLVGCDSDDPVGPSDPEGLPYRIEGVRVRGAGDDALLVQWDLIDEEGVTYEVRVGNPLHDPSTYSRTDGRLVVPGDWTMGMYQTGLATGAVYAFSDVDVPNDPRA